MAGEGVEYTWGVVKSVYRSKPIEMKSSRDKFIATLKQIIMEKITKNNVRKFSKRARNFMICYEMLGTEDIDKISKNEIENNLGTKLISDEEHVGYEKIMQVTKTLRSHRGPLDTCTKYIRNHNEVMNNLL